MDVSPPSPDGREVIARLKGAGTKPDRWFLVPLDGTAPRPCELPDGCTALQWTTDGRSLFITDWGGTRPAPVIDVSVVDIATGKRRPWRTLVPPDVVGVRRRSGRGAISVTPDGRWYAYRYSRTISDLYVVEGLR